MMGTIFTRRFDRDDFCLPLGREMAVMVDRCLAVEIILEIVRNALLLRNDAKIGGSGNNFMKFFHYRPTRR